MVHLIYKYCFKMFKDSDTVFPVTHHLSIAQRKRNAGNNIL